MLPVYKQDMMIPDPSGTVLVDRDRVPRRRKKAWPHEEVLKPPEGAADPEGFRDDRVTENIPMLISNDPAQYPYRGKFAAQRAAGCDGAGCDGSGCDGSGSLGTDLHEHAPERKFWVGP